MSRIKEKNEFKSSFTTTDMIRTWSFFFLLSSCLLIEASRPQVSPFRVRIKEVVSILNPPTMSVSQKTSLNIPYSDDLSYTPIE